VNSGTRRLGEVHDGQVDAHVPQVRLAVAVAAVDLVITVGVLAVVADRAVFNSVEETGSWINLAAGPTFPLVAALLFRVAAPGASRRRLAWLMLAFGPLSTATFVLHFSAQAALDGGRPGAAALAWVSTWLWVGVPTGLLLLLLWFPTGDVPGPRWRWLQPLVGFAAACMWLSIAFRPGETEDFAGFDNPLGAQPLGDALLAVGVAGFAALAVAAAATAASVVWRFWSADGDVRAQLRWLVVAVGLIVLTVVMPNPDALRWATVGLGVLSALVLPITLAVALVRPEDVALPRVLVFALLSALLLTGYLGIVGLARAAFGPAGDGLVALVAAGVVAVAAAPLRSRLQRSVDRLVYGDRGDPHAAVVELGRRVAATPDDPLAEVVSAVARALRAPYVAVHLVGDAQPAAEAGQPTDTSEATEMLPLQLQGQPVGSLVVARRHRWEAYGPRDLRLLDELAGQIAVAAHAAVLTRDLRRSRESLVLAREEERRRLRRDLHDGLGPALAGVAFGIDAARRGLPPEAAPTESALRELTAEVQAAVADIRHLVDDLRPPALDQLGLVPAVEAYAARLSARGGPAIDVAAADLPTLPAAVEVAAYRTVTEALTNVARHSGAQTGRVSLCLGDGELRIEVIDDGCGVPAQRDGKGVGLSAMAERAAELGGSCTVLAAPGGGTAVVSLFPIGGTA
jgi:signal transduction histidine kinase